MCFRESEMVMLRYATLPIRDHEWASVPTLPSLSTRRTIRGY